MIFFGAGAAGASIVDAGPVQVGTTSSDQPADLIAVSNCGAATGTGGCLPLLPPLVPEACMGGSTEYPGLVAVSTTGSATDAFLAAVTIHGGGCADSWALSVSISGNACDGVVAVSVLGDASSDFLAVSGLGSAQSGGFAVSGGGPATGNSGAISGTNYASGPIAVSPRVTVRDLTPIEFRGIVDFALVLLETGQYTASDVLYIVLATITNIVNE